MAKLSYRRLATALVAELGKRSAAEVAEAAVAMLRAHGQRLELERLLPELERELLRQHGHLVVHATSAQELPSAEYEKLATEVARELGATTHEVVAEVDPGLLGGVRLATADRQLDLSLQTQLQQLTVQHG